MSLKEMYRHRGKKKRKRNCVCMCVPRNTKKIHSDQLHQFPGIIASPACSFSVVFLSFLFFFIFQLIKWFSTHTAFIYYNLINITKLQ